MAITRANAVTRKDLVAFEKTANAELLQPRQQLGKSAGNQINTSGLRVWPNTTFLLDNSESSAAQRFLLADPTGQLRFFLGKDNFAIPTSIGPDLDFERFNNYLLSTNMAIDTLMLRTSSNPGQFDEKFELIYGLPGNLNVKDISDSIEFLQDPGNYTQLLLKGDVNPMVPIDRLNSPLITVLPGEVYRVTASFRVVNGLPVAGMVNPNAQIQ